jgi:transglutaminase-like putative cysteine protease
VKIITRIDGENGNTESLALLGPSETYEKSIKVNTSYKSADMVTVEASCSLSSDSKTIILNDDVSRVFSENPCCSFVKPNDQNVVELKNRILADKTPVTANWMAFRDWIGNNIEYTSDYEAHGEEEYWQFPNETIQLETGDCEDFFLLLCSLLRADGWSSDDVFVVFGEKNNQYHAWVRVIWNGMQYNIEPQGNGFAIAIGDILSLSGYSIKYYFNDLKVGSFE